MPRKSRKNWMFILGVAVFFGLISSYVGWPWFLGQMGIPPADTEHLGIVPGLGEQMRERATTAIVSLWFFVLGATIGSFLNVVAYRMPMGMTFVSKPSRCPYCVTPIRFHHNVPILGWLVLRGRCFSCRLPISPRYILVEIALGLMFFTVFLAEIASGGRNLPVRVPNLRSGVMWNLFTPQYDLIGMYLLHVFLISVIATISLIQFDRLTLPRRLTAFALAIGIIARAIFPSLAVLPPVHWTAVLPIPVIISVAFESLAFDLFVGAGIGLLFEFIVGDCELPRNRRSAAVVVCSLVGLYVGWHSVAPAVFIGSVFQLILAAMLRGRWSELRRAWTMSLLVGIWITLCFWRQLPIVWFPSADGHASLHVATLGIALGAAYVASFFSGEELIANDGLGETNAVEGATSAENNLRDS